MCTFSFKEIYLKPIAPNLLDMLPRQNWAGKLILLLSDLN